MKPICFISARGGSKGIPNKNIRIVGGRPLIAHAIKSAIDSKLFSHVIVSTDSKRIKKIAMDFGAEVPFMRPKKLASDSIGIVPVIIHGIKNLKALGYDFDTILTRDCTVPFITKKNMGEALLLFDSEKCDGVYSVYEQHLNPYFNMVEVNKGGFLEISKKTKKEITSRQKSPIVYQLNGLFVFDVSSLLKQRKIFMSKILPYEITQKEGFMIDTKFEFKIAKLLMK